MTSRALLLVNPRSRRGSEAYSDLQHRLSTLGLEIVQQPLGGHAEIGDIIARHRAAIDRVIVAGGDGSLNVVVQALVGTGLPLGVLPLGTANNLARTLAIPMDLSQACQVAVSGQRRQIDLGQVNGRYFFTTASIGLSVKITEALTTKTKQRWGPLAYGVAALRALTRSRPFRADITWPDGSRHTRTVQIVIGNGRYYGSALPVAADARIDDAFLDLYSLEVGHWLSLIALVPSLRRGEHGSKRSVEALRAKEFEIRTVVRRKINLDGEVCSETPARFQVVPGALEVFTPDERPA